CARVRQLALGIFYFDYW
nr:immunoglobulin heavy chain junction region [Macaca mulatta]MOV42273.1 immunoglobulin heavy chain junction region [Macaca mulatta]